jgi:putative ABC transport system ATP-binding protein
MIKATNLRKIYRSGDVETVALDNISFKIEKGEFVSIMGPSGSGKSTLMHILGALDIPSSGEYLINGTRISNMSDDDLAELRNKEIGFVFQAYNLIPRSSALKNVVLPMILGGVDKKTREERAKELLSLVGLENRMFHTPDKLSGGQKQRVAIARALTMNPSIILADEPTGNLPSTQGKEIMDIFENLNKNGHTILVITHEDAVAERTNRIITLVDGKIVGDRRIK